MIVFSECFLDFEENELEEDMIQPSTSASRSTSPQSTSFSWEDEPTEEEEVEEEIDEGSSSSNFQHDAWIEANLSKFAEVAEKLQGPEPLMLKNLLPGVNVKLRELYLRLFSFLHNQICSPRFNKFLEIMWLKPGYKTPGSHREKQKDFQTVIFQVNAEDECDFEGCDGMVRVKCSWTGCSSSFCYLHFILPHVHYHEYEW